jgi:hypothetical protein
MAFSGIQVGFRHNPGFRPFWGMGVLGGGLVRIAQSILTLREFRVKVYVHHQHHLNLSLLSNIPYQGGGGDYRVFMI